MRRICYLVSAPCWRPSFLSAPALRPGRQARRSCQKRRRQSRRLRFPRKRHDGSALGGIQKENRIGGGLLARRGQQSDRSRDGESRAGKPLADVVLTTTSTLRLIQKDGFLAKYDSPSAKAFPKTVIDPNLGPAYRSTVIGVVYHTGIIKPAEAPKSLEDLVKAAIQRQGRGPRSQPAHDDGAVAGEFAQDHGQGEG